MVTIDQLPLELWQRILSYLDEDWEWSGLSWQPEQYTTPPPIKALSLVCRVLRMRTLTSLFAYIKIGLQFFERKVFKGEDLVFSEFVSFIRRSGLQGKKVHFTFQIRIHEKKKGKRPPS